MAPGEGVDPRVGGKRMATDEPISLGEVEFRSFAGMTEEEIAEVPGVSARTVQRDWIEARAWLYRALYPEGT